MNPLQEVAIYAAQKRIRGKSYRRNSLLKPLDIILTELDRSPNIAAQDELELIYAGSKGLIYDHLKRIAKGVHEEEVYHYVDLFFQRVLELDNCNRMYTSEELEALKQRVDELLQRERLIRSAYLVYMRQELANFFVQRGQAKSPEEAIQAMQSAEEQDDELDEGE
jgi:hypothetical protein